ncbi:hypothetical protein [Pseudalkalibacillus sp. SCS-8]|uniref:esterase/lipase family protein n=1 Tax=Pseudalkalibacillus nanhaiensis TaxID=3115291 RepID=UPI0032DB82F4
MKKGITILSASLLFCSLISPTMNASAEAPEMAETPGMKQGKGINSSIMYEPEKDYDGDGLTNQQEDDLGLNILEEDTDYDQIIDGIEVDRYGTDPAIADTDGDHLDDGDEIFELGLDPLDSDENQNGVKDGMETRTVPLIENTFGITGDVTGVGSIYGQYTIEDNPIIILNKMDAAETFYFDTLNKGLTFNLQIPVPQSMKSPVLLMYRIKSGKLEKIDQQKFDRKKGLIETEFMGGGTVVLAERGAVMKAVMPSDVALTKLENLPLHQPIQIANMPGLRINKTKINEVIKDRKGKIITEPNVIVFEEIREFVNEQVEGTDDVKKAYYKIDKVFTNGKKSFATISSVSTESGNQPTIMLHGLNSNTARWGFDKLWENSGSKPKADEYINSYESFTGTEYALGYTSSYGNHDVHYLYDGGNTAQLGWQLNVDFNYTPNVDLFGFNYEHNGHVAEGADWLKHYIGDLESLGYINSYDDINLIGHSKGGLVSRYLIENLGYDWYIDRLMTFGTPHFGSDKSFFGTDLDRFGSDLWGADHDDPYCAEFTNDHTFTLYFAVGAWDKASIPDAIENKWIVAPNLNGTPNDVNYSYHQEVTDLFNQHGMYFSSTPEIDDVWVNMDSALGSDDDKMDNNGISPGTHPKVTMHKRWYIFDDVYGDHGKMTEHADADNETYKVLSGQYD